VVDGFEVLDGADRDEWILQPTVLDRAENCRPHAEGSDPTIGWDLGANQGCWRRITALRRPDSSMMMPPWPAGKRSGGLLVHQHRWFGGSVHFQVMPPVPRIWLARRSRQSL